MKTVLAAAFLAAIPVAVAAQPAADDFARGRELRLAGRPADAIPLLEAASRASPGDADVWLNLGLAYVGVQRLADADRALNEALRIAPGYRDVQLAQARVAFYRGDVARARQLAAPLVTGARDDEASALIAQLDAARGETAPAWRLDVAFARSDISAPGLEDWLRGTVALSRRVGEGASVGGSVEQVRQFGLEDTYLEATVGGRRGYISVGGTPDADFRPDWQVRGGLNGPSRAIGDWRVGLSLDGAWARYFSGDVRSLQPTATLYKGDSFLAARWINTLDERDEYRSGYSVFGSWSATPRLRFVGGYADAPESTEGVTVKVRSISAGVAVDLDDVTSVRLDGVHEMRRAYDRTELAVAVTRRF